MSSRSSFVSPQPNITATKIATQELAYVQNKETAKYYVASVMGLMCLFTVFHWGRLLYARHAPKSWATTGYMRHHVALTRLLESRLMTRLPGFTSRGHSMLAVGYISINVILIVTNMQWSPLIPMANRLGWLAILNITFVTFLAVRNTPLGILTAHSYEHLTQLHTVAGYTTFIFCLIHVTLEIVGMIRLHMQYKLLETRQINGTVVLVAIFIMLVFGAFHRKLGYELFYLSHVIMYIVIIVGFVFHPPENRPAAVIPAIVAGSIWVADRVIRLLRILWYSYDNRATILPLPQGATRIIIKRAPSTSVPGSHCYLWIPKIRPLETHPFTIVNKSKSSLEFVVSAYDGFTRDLHAHAVRYPGTSLQASFDGPYGSVPDYSKNVDKAIFIAGGSGASFTFGVALEMIKRLRDLEQPTVEFIWVVREKEIFPWFAQELDELQACRAVNITLHSTKRSLKVSKTSSPRELSLDEGQEHMFHNSSPTSTSRASDENINIDIEKVQSRSLQDTTRLFRVFPGRPDVESMIRNVVARSNVKENILIVCCGPDQMVGSVRKAAAGCINMGGPKIKLLCEKFSL